MSSCHVCLERKKMSIQVSRSDRAFASPRPAADASRPSRPIDFHFSGAAIFLKDVYGPKDGTYKFESEVGKRLR
ncbi:hypothetical protein EVAR_42067_1 [Eumeta japonica]|uniref:Uncharacterized protein n=1 Tax=Eumeta variegata TaxID=151549 RepID=A0A4C1XUH4_EUMVA|nr:hypothetical protein EVAR_42067_1 [Eumeta japonica]